MGRIVSSSNGRVRPFLFRVGRNRGILDVVKEANGFVLYSMELIGGGAMPACDRISDGCPSSGTAKRG